jgi:hypothetical protein
VLQRRAGLEISKLKAHYDAADLAHPLRKATDYERLGDYAINTGNKTARHQAGLYARHTAMRAVTAPDAQAAHAIKRGAKGGATAVGKTAARAKYRSINSTHVPDLYREHPTIVMWEWKCYTPFLPTPALGHGSNTKGGAPSQVGGHLFAMGNTLECLTVQVFGVKARGSPDDKPFNHTTGVGRVHARDGHYADAISHGRPVHLFATESSGALSRPIIKEVRRLAKASAAKGGTDHTAFGTGRTSQRKFFPHHLASISSAIVMADADLLLGASSADLDPSPAHPRPVHVAL